jgi:di/tricarboxylate transporter
LINWDEANRAPWGVIMMFGGGLALASASAPRASTTGSASRCSRSGTCIR